MIIRAGKRPFLYCINKECPKRVAWKKEQEKKKELEKKEEPDKKKEPEKKKRSEKK